MNWREHIYSDPEIGGGKPIFRGTRFKVEFVLKLIAAGWTYEQMAAEYPGILPEHLRAAAAFAADMMRDEEYVAIGQAQAI
ncbi:MAG: hypothetical protein AVDCRST_MAG23-2559 [uncultured Sphingosinicella sp.]|uniref:DUF433 domain-containing protein n=1 Tax=uncultured Sphingosinicella sp. TaxID=478748 RepID=A0A6J4UDE2_9SPHN|nr:DUF433 domain-containing protein [uncultured Sphingosinicella sp.]CAA9546151.1 MAG: hypothetical protein AVDCRST_MAG23-2559 [uncultured Sphingosinicella sp.]